MNIFPRVGPKINNTVIVTVRMLWFCPVPYFMFKELCRCAHQCAELLWCLNVFLQYLEFSMQTLRRTIHGPFIDIVKLQSYIPIGSISSCIFTWHEQLKSMVNGKHTIHGSYGMNPVPFSSQGVLRCLDFHRLSLIPPTWEMALCPQGRVPNSPKPVAVLLMVQKSGGCTIWGW